MNQNARPTGLDVPDLRRGAIQNWLIQAISEKLKIRAEEIKTDIPFDEYGLDSVDAVAISGALSDWLQRDFPGTLLFEYPTVDELAAHLEATVE